MIYIDSPIPVGRANLISPYRDRAYFKKRKLWDNNMKDVWTQKSYKEICINNDEDEQCMIALINGNFGWLMYLREEGDAGFSSRNPDYQGGDTETMSFYLSNGQLDEYPLSWVLPIDQIKNALDYFDKNHRPPKFIIWHNDSEDGVSLD